MLRFDLRQLTKSGRVAAGQSYSWCWFRDEERIASISVRTIPDAFLLDYTWTPSGSRPQVIACRIELTQTPCALGGCRRWFVCPDCGRLCLVLFGISRRGNFACRACQRLAYASEAESPVDRCWRAQRKLEAKLTDDGKRPKGMRQRTFERIKDKWATIEERKDNLLWPSLLRLAGYLDRKSPV
ncbi:hypothetical protein [Peristeroidobacter agariperforans]|uniref:hypothetical protein n=1 Tax=Peristeroidobacter agariperforans TaxID=268404 RepID=UPI00101B868F|nr:hypothetical protein [Peristeroidobacter agariperforans]